MSKYGGKEIVLAAGKEHTQISNYTAITYKIGYNVPAEFAGAISPVSSILV